MNMHWLCSHTSKNRFFFTLDVTSKFCETSNMADDRYLLPFCNNNNRFVKVLKDEIIIRLWDNLSRHLQNLPTSNQKNMASAKADFDVYELLENVSNNTERVRIQMNFPPKEHRNTNQVLVESSSVSLKCF